MIIYKFQINNIIYKTFLLMTSIDFNRHYSTKFMYITNTNQYITETDYKREAFRKYHTKIVFTYRKTNDTCISPCRLISYALLTVIFSLCSLSFYSFFPNLKVSTIFYNSSIIQFF